jgi:hypothetical protein
MALSDETRKVKDLSQKLSDTNKKRQQAEERFSRIKSVHVPKLTKTRDTVMSIVEALQRIKEDTGLLPDMFKRERKVNREYKEYVDEAQKERDEAVSERAGLIAKKNDLDLEVSRKIRLAQQAIGAR